eukprot:6352576-Heterocapsa_arctica.AAC.1
MGRREGSGKLLFRFFGAVTSHYIDDFSVAELFAMKDDPEKTIGKVFELLGWATKQQKVGCEPF